MRSEAPATGERLGFFPIGDATVTAMAFSPDGTVLVTATTELTYAWDVATGRHRQKFRSSALCTRRMTSSTPSEAIAIHRFRRRNG